MNQIHLVMSAREQTDAVIRHHCFEVTEEGKQTITKEAAREYLKTCGGFWSVKPIPMGDEHFFYCFKVWQLFGEPYEVFVSVKQDSAGDHNVYRYDASGTNWMDAIPGAVSA